MKQLRLAFLTMCAVIAAIALSQPVLATIVQQQAQVAVTIIINVTPAPVGYHAAPKQSGNEIAAHFSVHGDPQLQRDFSAESLHFVPTDVVAQAAPTAQAAVKVEANVSPNPNATLLFTDLPGVTVNAVAGSTVVVPCAYHVTVDTARTNWQLDHGLSNDMAAAFPGKDIGNNTYVAAPNATATPFVVYADNGSHWALIGSNSGVKTYCVDLTVTVPTSVGQGAYSTNAVYTLYF